MNTQTILNPDLNRVPEGVRNIHIMGICGTGMAALAGMLKENGYFVTGSDENVYPPMSDFLASCGIEVQKGYGEKNLEPRPDLVVVGNVITAKNPEAQALGKSGIQYVSMPQALGSFFLQDHTSLVVSGTHGKTTTSSLLASTLHHANRSPGFLIGGIVREFDRNYGLGKGEFFVVEGDEYDTAFFDKESKFFHYRPHIAIFTSIEFDHADIFSDFGAIKKSFRKFIGIIPKKGALIACFDDPEVVKLTEHAPCEVISYGSHGPTAWKIDDFQIDGLTSQFTLLHREKEFGSFSIPLPGKHNILNATAVIALLNRLGLSREAIATGLASFGGIKRRQQIRGVENGVTIIDDFAHHPTAVRETLAALKLGHADSRLVAVFEPRTNSSRRDIFQEQYSKAFDSADLIVVREHIPLSGIPMEKQFSGKRLVSDLQKRGLDARCFADTDTIIDYLIPELRQGDVVAILSNGGFDDIHERLLDKLRNLRPAS